MGKLDLLALRENAETGENVATADLQDLLVLPAQLVLKVSRVLQDAPESLAPREIRDGLECLAAWDPLDLLVPLETMGHLDQQDLPDLRAAMEGGDLPAGMVNPDPKDDLAVPDPGDLPETVDQSVLWDLVDPADLLEPRATLPLTHLSHLSAAKDP